VLTSRLFVPTLQLIYAASEQMPPFLVITDVADYTLMSVAFGIMLIAGLLILISVLRKLKPDQVLKLGED